VYPPWESRPWVHSGPGLAATAACDHCVCPGNTSWRSLGTAPSTTHTHLVIMHATHLHTVTTHSNTSPYCDYSIPNTSILWLPNPIPPYCDYPFQHLHIVTIHSYTSILWLFHSNTSILWLFRSNISILWSFHSNTSIYCDYSVSNTSTLWLVRSNLENLIFMGYFFYHDFYEVKIFSYMLLALTKSL